VSYLEMAKRVSARLRAERTGDEGNEVNEVSKSPVADRATSFVSFVNFVAVPSYSHPWPDVLPGLGPLRVGPFDPCSDCAKWSWVRYGDVVLCLPCVRRRAPL
jgi:hypothetical protein